MDRIDKYRRVEEDQLQEKGKAKVISQEKRDFRSDRYNSNRPRKDFVEQSGSVDTQVVNAVFREPVQQVLEKIKNGPFFKWPNKMVGESKRRNPNLYCHYHQDHGHTTENCRNLWDHLEQLVREGKLLKQFLHHSNGRVSQAGSEMRGDASSRLPLADEVKCEDLERVIVADNPERFFQVGAKLPLQEKERLLEFLRTNVDVFAWSPYEAPGVDPNFICHRLNVNPSVIPKRQPPRRPSKEHAKAVRTEVTKLKQARAIKELVDATVGHPQMSFLDAFQGYHQIPLALDDQEKTAFVTPIGNYHYKVMSFSLKNAGSTYQWMMTKMFEPQLGRSIEVYIDDMVVKSKMVSEHVEDLMNIFGILRKHKLRLNASKCSFSVGSERFLGYMVTHRGIEVNPDQIKAINDLQAPWTPKEVQKLTRMTASLNRFISRSAERCRPFFLLLHKWKGFEWTEECAVAFQQLKEYLSKPSIMSSSKVDEMLFAYLAVAPYVVSFVLIREDSDVQRPIYYVSKSFHEAEVRYLSLEKAILVVVHATRKLPHYFQAHTVVVLTQLPLKSILRSADYTGRIAKWGTILGAFVIKCMPHTSVKGQVLADLVAEFAECLEEANMKQNDMDEKSVGLISTQGDSSWRVYVDGAANQRGAGLGLVLIYPKEITIEKSLRLGFSATNNEAEYETLLMGMSMVQKMDGKIAELFSDSRLVVGQVKGELEARDPRMQGYLSQVRRMQTKFESFILSHIP
ncbi:uncharacterized protein LOC115991003 [Quercus lobata]|uniref:uncharacterized protein LOC115991003 n=1 Tax=Quercus lobata TaxID=97700 RepID=UPI001245E496|nr:uncharacterized protein LOC115991003 [Quercus lobata]